MPLPASQQTILDETYAACDTLLKAASDGSLRRRSVAPGLLHAHHGHNPLMAGYYAQSLPLLEDMEIRLKKALRGSGLCCQSRIAVVLSQRWLTLGELGDHGQFVYWLDSSHGIRIKMTADEQAALKTLAGINKSDQERPLHAPKPSPYDLFERSTFKVGVDGIDPLHPVIGRMQSAPTKSMESGPTPDPIDTTTLWNDLREQALAAHAELFAKGIETRTVEEIIASGNDDNDEPFSMVDFITEFTTDVATVTSPAITSPLAAATQRPLNKMARPKKANKKKRTR